MHDCKPDHAGLISDLLTFFCLICTKLFIEVCIEAAVGSSEPI